MNQNTDLTDPTTYYYDADYPSETLGKFPENFDSTTSFQGIARDVPRYLELAREHGGPILEVCCGTGRVLIPLARAGFEVTGVDISDGFLTQLRQKLEAEAPETSGRVKAVRQNATELSLETRDFASAIFAFNSLLCIPDFEAQRAALRRVAGHLRPGGLLILDLVNPLGLKLAGDGVAKPFYTRKNPHNGNTFTRFSMCDALDEGQRQRLHGWYDEVDSGGRLSRRHYSMFWRPIFRFEIELMLEAAGLRIVRNEGGHQKEPYTSQSAHMLIQARKS
jgi:SAM-dependent methyltransferase